jgi:DNA-binding SARP family transcriptional activator
MLAAAGLPRDALTTSPTGYRLNHASCSRDVDVLDAMMAAARSAIAAADLERASVLLRSALALWRGPSLDCVSAAFVAAESVMLEERRLSVLCDLADVQFARGRSGDVIPHLTGYLHAHPLDEGIRLRLMRALSELGRRADALSVYRQGRDIMVAELGLEPGPALRLAEAAILRGDPVDISLTGRHVC